VITDNPWEPIPDDVLRALQRLGLTPDNFEAEVRRLREFKQRVEDDLNAAGVSFGMVARTVKDYEAALERAQASESTEVRRSAEARARVARTVEEREAEILRLEEKALALLHDRNYWHQRATDAEMGASA